MKSAQYSIDYYPYNKIINRIIFFPYIYCHKGTYIVCHTNTVPCVPVIIECGWWIEQHMALTDVAVSIRCARLLICYQSDKVMCEIPYLSLWTKSIDCLSLFASLSLIFLCPPHLTPQHIFSLCLFFCFCFFLVYWTCLAKNTESLYLPFLQPHTVYLDICEGISLLIYSGQTFSSSSSHVNWLSPF